MIQKLVFSFVLLAVVALGTADEITFRDCGSTARAIEKIEVTNCNKTHCNIVKGEEYEVVVHFISTIGPIGTSLDIDMKGKSSIVESSIIKTENGEGCEGLNSGCPFPGGAQLVHTTKLQVGLEYFEMPAVITHKLVDNNLRNQVCIETDIVVVAAPAH